MNGPHRCVTLALALLLGCAAWFPAHRTAAAGLQRPGGLTDAGWHSLQSQVAKLTSSDGSAYDYFGSVALSGDTAVVGAYLADVGGHVDQGAAYVFYRNRGGPDAWGQVAKLTASDGVAGDGLGGAVAVRGDTAVAGAYFAHIGLNAGQGAAYVFSRNEGGLDAWGQVAKLTALDGAAGDGFGCAVAVGVDAIVVGAHSADVGGNLDQGAVYVFDWLPGGGQASSEVTKLVASDGVTDDHFGASISVSGDTVLVGAVSATVAEKGHQGAAYVFDRNLGGSEAWRQVAKLTASDGEEGDYFGRVALSGDTALVGASYARVGWNVEQGAAYVYYRNQGGANAWGEVVKLLAADGSEEDYFGSSVSLDGDMAVIGAVGADDEEESDEGAAYTFGRNLGGPAAWGQLAKITADDATEHDWFGVHAAVSGDTVLIGAPVARVSGREGQGAAYVFGPPGPRYVVYVPFSTRTPASP